MENIHFKRMETDTSTSDIRKEIARLFSISDAYLKCNILGYDEHLHSSIDKVIEQLEAMEGVFDEMLPKILERHFELLNLRMKLIQYKVNEASNAVAKMNAMVKAEAKAKAKAEAEAKAKAEAEAEAKAAAAAAAATPAPIVPDNTNTRKSNRPKPGSCFYCYREDHKSEDCPIFPLPRRSNIIFKRECCFRCLEKSYICMKTCEAFCTVCGRGHHVSICDPAKVRRRAM